VARQLHDFDPPERFVVGTVGQPGERTFFLQARGPGRLVSVALEKAQVSVLTERLIELLDEVARRGGDVPSDTPREFEDVAPLDAPIEEEFRVGTLALAWDGPAERVVIEAHATVPDGEAESDLPPPDDDDTGPDLLRVHLVAGAARGFAARALRVVAAGRPPCPLCGMPLDPEGHICPRLNGQRH
jgi:uncharacterized repeat protein (TIGR03847 family)